MESTAASRLPPLLSRYHERYPAVRVELISGTTDALLGAVLSRKVEAAFVADCASTDALESTPAFDEQLVLIAGRSHPKIEMAKDVRADTIISFPVGCAYRRRLQAWLSAGGLVPEKGLELSSYHAIVACVASGTGIAFVPRSVLDTIRPTSKSVVVYPLPAKTAKAKTTLISRKGEESAPLRALRQQVSELRNSGQ
jgi:DNA-binding transcriptional LysR family regulator